MLISHFLKDLLCHTGTCVYNRLKDPSSSFLPWISCSRFPHFGDSLHVAAMETDVGNNILLILLAKEPTEELIQIDKSR